MNTSEFKEKVRDGVGKVVESSKKAIGRAGEAVQDFSDKSVIRIEKHQFESKREAVYVRLGTIVAEKLLSDNSATVSAGEEEIAALLQEIAAFNAEIARREAQLAADGRKAEGGE